MDLARLSWQCHLELVEALDGRENWGWRECGAVGLRCGGSEGQSRSAYRDLPQGKKEVVEKDWLEGEREDLTDGQGGAAAGIGQMYVLRCRASSQVTDTFLILAVTPSNSARPSTTTSQKTPASAPSSARSNPYPLPPPLLAPSHSSSSGRRLPPLYCTLHSSSRPALGPPTSAPSSNCRPSTSSICRAPHSSSARLSQQSDSSAVNCCRPLPSSLALEMPCRACTLPRAEPVDISPRTRSRWAARRHRNSFLGELSWSCTCCGPFGSR